MKNSLKHWLKRINWLLIAVLMLATFVRFYNFSNRVTFWSEQARSLIVSANYIKEKPSLLGQEYFRVDSNGHKLFSGALFNYSLVPLLLIFSYDPISITGYFALLNVFTGLAIYLVVGKIFNKKLALISTILFLFNDFMIYHSLFIWNYNYLPLLGILSFYFSRIFFEKKKTKYIFILGLLAGIGVSLQFLFLPIALLLYIFNIWRSKNRFRDSLFFIAGMMLGNFPMIIFDLKHNFYHMVTLLQYGVDTLKGNSDAGLSYYYFLPFWPLLAILGGYIVLKISKFNNFPGFLIVAIYLYCNLISPKVSFSKPIGMPEGIIEADIDRASKVIAMDVQTDFNVAEVLDFDKRAYVLRYFVEFKYGRKPLDEISYPYAPVLYVLSEKNYNFKKSGVWEISSGGPRKISELTDVGQGYSISKLQK